MDLSSLKTRDECLHAFFQHWTPVPETELVPIDDAHGRILAENLYSKYDFPVFRASMMDGIAVRSSDFSDGLPDTSTWKPGRDYVRADTGDDFDDAFDAVIQIEMVDIHPDGSVTLHLPEGTRITPGRSIRNKGSQLAAGQLVAAAGRRCNAVTLGAAAAGGHHEIPVIRKPRVGYIPTGSELIPPDHIPARGQNIASNTFHIRHLITGFGGIPTCYPIIPDDPDQLHSAFSRAFAENDIVLMSGGSSKGEEDYTTRILSENGTEIFRGVRCVPGRPMSGFLGDGKPLINLSGPPVAALHGMFWLVRPLIARFLGVRPPEPQKISAVLGEDVEFPGVMQAFRLFTIVRGDDGTYYAFPQGAQRSGKPGTSAVSGSAGRPEPTSGDPETPAPSSASRKVPDGIRNRIPAAIRESDYGLLANAFYINEPGEAHHSRGETLTFSLLVNEADIS